MEGDSKMLLYNKDYNWKDCEAAEKIKEGIDGQFSVEKLSELYDLPIERIKFLIEVDRAVQSGYDEYIKESEGVQSLHFTNEKRKKHDRKLHPLPQQPPRIAMVQGIVVRNRLEIGAKYDRLTVLSPTDQKGYNNHWLWMCACDCGRIAYVEAYPLKRGYVKSCGCMRGWRKGDTPKYEQIKKGDVFGMLTAVKFEYYKNRMPWWGFKCECGKYKIAEAYSVMRGSTWNCGNHSRADVDDLTGQRFGKLFVIGLDKETKSGGNAMWKCRCDCGSITSVRGNRLRGGQQNCSKCINRKEGTDVVGISREPSARVWGKLRKKYNDGLIIMEEEWVNSLSMWISDVGHRPDNHLIALKDKKKGYIRGNVYWKKRDVKEEE
jgi:hypothetical protein